MRYFLAMAGLFLSVPSAFAQADSNATRVAPAPETQPASDPSPNAPPATEPVAIIESPKQENILRAGTEIPLTLREELTTKKKKLRVGQRFQMEVASNVTKNGIIIIPAGTPALGEITEVRNKGMWGKSGYIGARILSLRLGDRQIRLTGTFDDKGVTGTGGVVASVVLLPLAGFFTTGTSAMIPMGGGVKGFLDEDIAFRPVAVQRQVLEVPVATQPAPPSAEPAAQSTSSVASPSAPKSE